MPDPQSLAKGLMSEGPVMRAYEPSWRDRMAAALMGDGRASPARAQVVMGLMGSRGLGPTGLSAIDATPAGAILDMQQAAQHGDKAGMAMAAAGVVPGAKVAEKVAAKVAEVAPAASKGIIAYHGSPHSFDKFDLSKIGTGEGAQAYGHGLYFAESEPVALEYRDKLSKWTQPDPDLIEKYGPTYDDLQKQMSDAVDKKNWLKSHEIMQQQRRIDRAVQSEMAERGHPSGSMYQVRINAEPEHFLDWDKPLSEQSHVIQERFSRAVSPGSTSDDELLRELYGEKLGAQTLGLFDRSKGSQAYNTFVDKMGDISKASDALREAGIPGIKYLDQGSRVTSGGELLDVFQGPNGWQSRIKVSGRGGAGFSTPTDSITTSKPFASEAEARAWADSKINSGSRNYVVFDDKIIEIMRKYGLAGSAGAAMAAEILQRQNGGQPLGQAVAPAM